MKRAIQPVVVVIAFAVATAGVARAAAPPFEPFEAAAAGFTIGIPKDWAPFDLSKETQAGVQRALKRAGAEHPDELAAIVPTLRAQGGVLYAVDPKQHDGLNANLNVVRGPLLNRTITDFDQALRAPFKNLKAKAPKIAPVEIDGVAGRKAAGRVKVGDTNVLLEQVIVPVGDKYLQFTLSLRPGAASKRLAGTLIKSIDLA